MSWEAVGAPGDFPDDTYVPKVITTVQGIGEVGKTTVYVRAYNPDIDGEKDPEIPGGGDFIAISTRCMHLGCPVRYVEASARFICPCHGGVYDFTGSVTGGPPVRPLDRFYTRVENGQVEIGPRYSVNSDVRALPELPRSRAGPRRHRPVPLPGPLLHAQARLMPRLPLPPLPSALQPKPRRPGEAEDVKPMDQAKEAGIHAVDWIDERTSLSGALRWVMFRKVPKGTNWFYTLGSATMFAFLSQAVTGVFLAMYYTPSVTDAYESTRRITNEIFLGEFVRGMHKWGSTMMVILIFLHMGRVFFFGAYKYPRELNWIIGFVLLVLTFVMSLTGYLLPFDQRSYWATIVAANITASGPIVGPFLGDFLRGGAEFGATTLSRFYSIHMLLVPGLIAAMIGAHIYLVTRLGTTAPPWMKVDVDEKLREDEV